MIENTHTRKVKLGDENIQEYEEYVRIRSVRHTLCLSFCCSAKCWGYLAELIHCNCMCPSLETNSRLNGQTKSAKSKCWKLRPLSSKLIGTDSKFVVLLHDSDSVNFGRTPATPIQMKSHIETLLE